MHKYSTHMLPRNARTNVVVIYYLKAIQGFRFLDKENKLIFEIGRIDKDEKVERVVLASEDVIIGVTAKLYPGYQSFYSDFQFRIATSL